MDQFQVISKFSYKWGKKQNLSEFSVSEREIWNQDIPNTKREYSPLYRYLRYHSWCYGTSIIHLTVTASITRTDSICPGCYTLRGAHNFSRRWSRNCHPARMSVTRHTCVLPVSPLLFKIAYFSMWIPFSNSNYIFPVSATCTTAHSNAASTNVICACFSLTSFYPSNELTTLPGISTTCINNNTRCRSSLIICGFGGYLSTNTTTTRSNRILQNIQGSRYHYIIG